MSAVNIYTFTVSSQYLYFHSRQSAVNIYTFTVGSQIALYSSHCRQSISILSLSAVNIYTEVNIYTTCQQSISMLSLSAVNVTLSMQSISILSLSAVNIYTFTVSSQYLDFHCQQSNMTILKLSQCQQSAVNIYTFTVSSQYLYFHCQQSISLYNITLCQQSIDSQYLH